MNGKRYDASVDICICTFRRPHLAATLQSLAQLHPISDGKISVIVADNDDTPSAKSLVDTISQTYPYPVRYLHAPARNISIARNACLDAATAPLIAFIDDDELATPGWLVNLVSRQKKDNADVVLGPVHSSYPGNAAQWLREGNFHSTFPVWVQGHIVTGYTCNVLFVREAPAIRGLRFLLPLGRSGGEDTAFFSAIHNAGGRIDYEPGAVVTEDVAPERLSFSWLLKRSFRSGQTHGMLLLANAGGTSFLRRGIDLLTAAAKALFCFVMAAGQLIVGRRARFWFLRGTLHAGATARLLGVSELIQYG